MPATFDEIIAQARRPETSVTLCLRGDLDADFRDLERQLQDASRVAPSLGERSPASLLAERIEALRGEMADAEQTFRLRALAPRAWSDLQSAQPAKTDDEDDAAFRDRFFGWVVRMVAACAIEPAMTEDQVAQLVDVLSGAQWDTLSNAAWSLNASRMAVPFSAAASVLTQIDKPN